MFSFVNCKKEQEQIKVKKNQQFSRNNWDEVKKKTLVWTSEKQMIVKNVQQEQKDVRSFDEKILFYKWCVNKYFKCKNKTSSDFNWYFYY